MNDKNVSKSSFEAGYASSVSNSVDLTFKVDFSRFYERKRLFVLKRNEGKKSCFVFLYINWF